MNTPIIVIVIVKECLKALAEDRFSLQELSEDQELEAPPPEYEAEPYDDDDDDDDDE